jgi:hypothetical protein
MKLPNKENAYIPFSKICDYLLSKTHPIGMRKSVFFESLGFSEANAEILESEIISIARFDDVKQIIESPYGTKYVIDGSIQTPTGKSVRLRTIWIIESGKEHPRFVTAYPS